MLYIVGTAIGNINDTTYRAAKTLSEANVILVEDTRSFSSYYKRILELFKFSAIPEQKIIPFHDQNEFEQTPYILKLLENNTQVALVSEAGVPLISDPGSFLLQQVIKNNIPYTVVPGPSALTTALALSGYSGKEPVIFLGFLPKKEQAVKKILGQYEGVIVFYESAERIDKTLQIINEIMPTAQVCICREMTKKFEEIARGTVKDLLGRKYKGELTVVLFSK
ncbi:16S rRNA (cytidine(1402)-2'-O)-methyltransferase [Candidatus Roizmanbacteria bacterium RIFCSPLOWO2_01_FULL_38_11]|uniref:16S rRNA (Cytidine(1402)-2'-O)-methyltransferase n=1 Tax=Candidatus Roizmanbacteria bacterium RIFCSPLOWO2_01_FULL_38_11 TaxID=1802060 RepID=A0A1F7IKD2_9BACT|nr:MAG: 16S rRNA (cytidine(1402)-2'-O)-methyltransferase [Candidatus Roizmanbacteria bacterium RIFCSPLOWO2_01_FULL_38_11]